MTIGTRIKARREFLGKSQEELAKEIGYKSRSSINKIELDLYNLKQSKIKAIADALDCTPSYIMGWEEATESVLSDSQIDTLKEAFAKLNSKGKMEAIKRVDELTMVPEYTVQDDTPYLVAAHADDDSPETMEEINRLINKYKPKKD